METEAPGAGDRGFDALELGRWIHDALDAGRSQEQVVEMVQAIGGVEPRRARDLVGRARLARRADRSASPHRPAEATPDMSAVRAELAALVTAAARAERARSRQEGWFALGGVGLFVGGAVVWFAGCAGLSLLLGKACGWLGLEGVVVSLVEKLVGCILGFAAVGLANAVGSRALVAGLVVGYGTYLYWIIERLR